MRARVLIAAAAVVAVVVSWLSLRTADGPGPSAAAPAARPGSAHVDGEPAGGATPVDPTATARAEAPEVEADPGDAAPAVAPAPDDGAPALRAEVHDATGGEIDLESVAVSLRAGARLESCSLARETSRFVSPPLAPARWTVEITAGGFHPLAVEIDLTDRSGVVEDAFELWPLDWLLVRARTSDGRPFATLAAGFGLEIEDVFEAGFRLWESDLPPQDAHASPPTPPRRLDDGLRMTSPHYDSGYEPDLVARLRREAGASSWIGLAFHERFLGWRHAPAGAREVVFTLAPDAVESQFASLDLRVVDRSTKEPIRGARVHLDAEVSGLRRADTDEVAVDDDGRAHVEPLIPGEYDLAVTAEGASEHRQRLVVPASTRVDLGDVELDFAPPIEVKVTDARGNPLTAILQLGPYRRGARVQDCVSPRAWTTNADGTERIPSPAVPTVVLASRVDFDLSAGRLRFAGRSSGSSSLVLLDPERLPPRVEIVIRDPVRVEIDATALGEAAAMARIEDSLEVVVDEDALESGATAVSLPPGSYRVRIVDAAGAELGARDFELTEGGAAVRVAVR